MISFGRPMGNNLTVILSLIPVQATVTVQVGSQYTYNELASSGLAAVAGSIAQFVQSKIARLKVCAKGRKPSRRKLDA